MKNRWTEEQDELIRKTYNKEKFPTLVLRKLPEFFGVSVYAIRSRATRIGASGPRSASRKPLSPWEKQYILDNADKKTVHQIVNGLRTKGSTRAYQTITGFLRKNGQCTSTRPPDLYTLTGLSDGFKCDRKTIKKWVDKGLLKTAKTSEERRWSFKPLDVARFIVGHPFELEGCRVDIPWMVALLLEFGNVAARLVRRSNR